ncbi:MAG: class I SAM-dependent methyltransferase [Chloroflexi bacterium]|nr:class I SAM-dependent methyltransferase [Chloroflexota bacterium]
MAFPRQVDQANVTVKWADVHRYSPAPRHRRRLICRWVKSLAIEDCLDAGCAQGYLLEDIVRRRPINAFGCDVSEEVILSNRQRLPGVEFQVVDLAKEVWPGGRQFDLVICSEVLEHIDDWQHALANLACMARRYLLITVPSGKVHAIDRHVGHSRHFHRDELTAAAERLGFGLQRARYWGFPFHTLYKYAINGVAADRVYASFGEQPYGPGRRAISMLLYLLFFANDLVNSGSQLLLLAERTTAPDD